MSNVKHEDLLKVNREGVDYKISAANMSKLLPTDYLVINRDGVDYRCTVEEFLNYEPPVAVRNPLCDCTATDVDQTEVEKLFDGDEKSRLSPGAEGTLEWPPGTIKGDLIELNIYRAGRDGTGDVYINGSDEKEDVEFNGGWITLSVKELTSMRMRNEGSQFSTYGAIRVDGEVIVADPDDCKEYILMEARELFWKDKADGTVSYDGVGAFTVTIPKDAQILDDTEDGFTKKLVNIPEGSVCAIPLYNSDDADNSLLSKDDYVSGTIYNSWSKRFRIYVGDTKISQFHHYASGEGTNTARNLAFRYTSDIKGPLKVWYTLNGRDATVLTGSVDAPLFLQPPGVDVTHYTDTEYYQDWDYNKIKQWAEDPDRKEGDVLIWCEYPVPGEFYSRHHKGGSIFVWVDADHTLGADGLPVEIYKGSKDYNLEESFIDKGSFVFSEKGLTQAGWTKVNNWLQEYPVS